VFADAHASEHVRRAAQRLIDAEGLDETRHVDAASSALSQRMRRVKGFLSAVTATMRGKLFFGTGYPRSLSSTHLRASIS
jgi:hypothetical protein